MDPGTRTSQREPGTALREHVAEVPVKYRRLYDRCLGGSGGYPDEVRAMCLQCVGWVRKDAVECQDRTCPLWRRRAKLFRSG